MHFGGDQKSEEAYQNALEAFEEALCINDI